ncbi:MAG TPA: divalent cation tolerance protein CutA [Verrucomicrobiae bacterium]|nr:divalent cation tolerance protein CutA [Verrucomicrobiae bacterium]
MNRYVVGLVTCPSRAQARKLARAVLAKKLAACVNILDGVESHYWWQGKLDKAREYLLLIKTTNDKTRAVTKTIKAHHSYEVPEVIFLPIVKGEANYLKWIRTSVAALALLLAAASTSRADRIDDLAKQLGSTNEEARAEGADALAQIGGPRVEKQFREMLKSDNPERRQMAVVGLLQVSDTDGDLQLVRERLKDENSTVRWSAALALGQSGRTESIAWLEEVAKSDESDSVKEAAAEAVTKLKSGVNWTQSLPDALKKARDLGKPVLAYFYLRGSEFCEKFDEGLLTDRAVLDEAEKFVCARVNAATQSEQARKYDVRGAPTILLLDSKGNEMSRVTGLVDKTTLLGKLSEGRRSKLTFREARRAAVNDSADVQANWKVAETYLEEGREDLAEPFLRNVVEHDESNQYGFTDNAMFALGFALGKRDQYAQAVDTLEHLLQRWPQFKDKDKALYCLGLSQLAVGQKDKGRATLEQLVREFPDSKTIETAKQALAKLGDK